MSVECGEGEYFHPENMVVGFYGAEFSRPLLPIPKLALFTTFIMTLESNEAVEYEDSSLDMM